MLEAIEHVRQAQRAGLSLAEIGPLLEAVRTNKPTTEQDLARFADAP